MKRQVALAGALALALTLIVMCSGCHRRAKKPSAGDVPPVTINSNNVQPPVMTASYKFEELGVRFQKPTDWEEGVAPALAGPGAKLLHKTGADKPTIVFVGISSRSYKAYQSRNNLSGEAALDAVASKMKEQVVAPGVPTGGSSGTATPQGKLISDSPWILASFVRGKVQRYQAADPKPENGDAQSVVDVYVGEGRGGSLYLFNVVADDTNGLDEARKILDTVAVTGVKDAGAENPMPPTGDSGTGGAGAAAGAGAAGGAKN